MSNNFESIEMVALHRLTKDGNASEQITKNVKFVFYDKVYIVFVYSISIAKMYNYCGRKLVNMYNDIDILDYIENNKKAVGYVDND